jgi:uncharacterized phage protein (TIGR02218 family)
MSDYQGSNTGSLPVTLYRFTRGSIQYCYCAADRDTLYNNAVYAATPITDSGIKQSSEEVDDDVVITLPWTAAVTMLYDGTPPSDEVFLTISELQFGDTTAYLTWTGSIVSCRKKDNATAEITCQTIAQSFLRDGLTMTYSRSCPYFLYDPTTCQVNPEIFQVRGIITQISGQDIFAANVGTKPDGWFNGGYVEWQIGGTTDTYERRAIDTQAGTDCTLIGLPDGLAVGMLVNFYPGCDRTCQTCQNKFDNLPNNGATPYLPGLSPFNDINVF